MPTPQAAASRSRAWGRACWAAFAFLTVWRAAARRVPPDDESVWGRAVACYPVVGALLGLLQAAAWWSWQQLAAPAAGWVAVAVGVALTGGLHIDGLMDAADGLWGGNTPEARLRIMRDERVGAFGVLAAIFALALKAAWFSGPGALLAPVLARAAVAWAVVRRPYARPQGLGRALKDHARPRHMLVAWALAGLWALGLLLARPGWAVPAAVLAVALWSRAWTGWVLRRIPGLTGDVYGALIEGAELVALLVLRLAAR